MAAVDSYDSDGGLEEISITDSNKQLMEKWYSINKHLKSEKEKVKEKRRNHHLLCAEQKKSKSGKVKEKSSGSKDSSQKLFESGSKKTENKTKKAKFDDDNANEKEDVETETEKLTTKPQSDDEEDDGCSAEEDDGENKSSEDFIAFDKNDGSVKPVCLRDLMKVDPGLESALAFKNKHLFGRHVHRQPMSSHLAMAEKRRARYPKRTNSTT